MKNLIPVILVLIAFSATSIAQNVPFTEPGHEGLNTKSVFDIDLKDNKILDFGIWVQYRALFNFSNIPGPGGSTFDTTDYYEFFRQRFRLGLDVRFIDNDQNIEAGGYAQFEYRGGWGGSSPSASDPRSSVPVINPYNRLQPRGLRYGFMYYDHKDVFKLHAGILPLTDQVGRILFDADWDFNVGGVTIGGNTGKTDYRFGYVRLIEGVGAADMDSIDKNGNMFLADLNYKFKNNLILGFHFYGMTAPGELGLMLPSYELWPGITFEGEKNKLKFKLLVLMNSGKIGSATHTGVTAKAETGIKLGKTDLSLLGLYATGDDDGKVKSQFSSLHGITGTAGFWAYLHIFTPSGPSDINDLGLNPGNGGAGLLTFQGKYDFPLKVEGLNGQIFTGYIGSAKKRNGTTFMGYEAGAMLSYSFVQFLKLELGLAYAAMGDFYLDDTEDLLEFFTRFQFTW